MTHRHLLPWTFAGLALLAACATSPLGRSQLRLFPESELDAMGATAYSEIRTKTPSEQAPAINDYVRCISDAITGEVPGTGRWEVTVFRDPSANAFALPGRKIGVYAGLLDVAENQDQLAAVIGHEVAHVLASHANERVSNAYAAEAGVQLASVFASGGDTQSARQMYGLLGLGAQVGVLLPFSRTQESEADLLGLDLMARAGFDPRESVTLWKNMGRQGGPRPPEFLSTHPSGSTRMRDLDRRMQHAMTLYEQARSAGKRPRCGR